VQQLVAAAKRASGPPIVFTFDPHPLALLRPELVPTPMTRPERKSELLAELGVAAVIAYPTDAELLKLSPDAFFQQIVCDRLGAKAVVEGPNFHFGRDRTGDINTLRSLGDRHGVMVEIVEPVITPESPEEPAMISSSRVRRLIEQGDIAAANRWLTQPYRLSGKVGRGAARGRTIGFPTANLDGIETVVPAPGVYAGRSRVRGKNFAAAVHVGPNITFGENALKVEVHLLDFHGDLYDQPLSIDLLARVRETVRFESADALIAQLKRDVEAVRALAAPFI
jgi:riboflavin kinase/FMN adenylyltransferase